MVFFGLSEVVVCFFFFLDRIEEDAVLSPLRFFLLVPPIRRCFFDCWVSDNCDSEVSPLVSMEVDECCFLCCIHEGLLLPSLSLSGDSSSSSLGGGGGASAGGGADAASNGDDTSSSSCAAAA